MIDKLRGVLDAIRKLVNKYAVCALLGHRSTGLLLWWMCDRCYADFRKSSSTTYVNGAKITTSPGLLHSHK